MIENLARWFDMEYVRVLYLTGGCQLAYLLVRLLGELDKQWEARQRVLSSPRRNVTVLGLGFFWIFAPIGPATLAVTTGLLGLAASTVWADVRGWEWRMWRRIWTAAPVMVPELEEAA